MSGNDLLASKPKWFCAVIYFFYPVADMDCLVLPVTYPARNLEEATAFASRFCNDTMQNPSKPGEYQLAPGMPIELWQIAVSEVPPEATKRLEKANPHLYEPNKKKQKRVHKNKLAEVVRLFPDVKKPDEDSSPKPPEEDPPKTDK